MSRRLKKKMKKNVSRIVLLLVIFPFLLDRFLAHRVYMLWCQFMKLESPATVGEWLSFLGSYLGVAGTVIIGLVAYWQTSIINRQSEGLNRLQEKVMEMQKELTDFQIHPVIRIKKTEIEIKSGLKGSFIVAKDLEGYYFSVYGQRWTGSGSHYVKIRIFFEDKGLIPVAQCEISDIEWKIGDHRYLIELNDIKRKISAYDVVNILVDDNDRIYYLTDDSKTPCKMDTFFADLDLHEHNNTNGYIGYDKSTLILKITYFNQKYSQSYALTYWIQSDNGSLVFGTPFLKREEERG